MSTETKTVDLCDKAAGDDEGDKKTAFHAGILV